MSKSQIGVDLRLPMTIKRAAKLLSVSPSGLRESIRRGVVPAIRIGAAGGGVRVIPLDAIEALKKRGR